MMHDHNAPSKASSTRRERHIRTHSRVSTPQEIIDHRSCGADCQCRIAATTQLETLLAVAIAIESSITLLARARTRSCKAFFFKKFIAKHARAQGNQIRLVGAEQRLFGALCACVFPQTFDSKSDDKVSTDAQKAPRFFDG